MKWQQGSVGFPDDSVQYCNAWMPVIFKCDVTPFKKVHPIRMICAMSVSDWQL